MNQSLVMTILGTDRPGLVSALSDTVAAHGGNWLESRMARLAGQFAGIARIDCPAAEVGPLLRKFAEMEADGLAIHAVPSDGDSRPERRLLGIEVIGNDRPGIVRELAAAIASSGGNVEEMTTDLESAPMAGHPIFRLNGTISMPEDADPATVVEALESLGGDVSVTITSAGS